MRLDVKTIDWIDAAGDYMCVHAEGHTYVLRETMKSLESVLDPEIFQRVHRSTIVNVRRVRRLRPHTNGEYFLTLDDGQEIKLEPLLSRPRGSAAAEEIRGPVVTMEWDSGVADFEVVSQIREQELRRRGSNVAWAATRLRSRSPSARSESMRPAPGSPERGARVRHD